MIVQIIYSEAEKKAADGVLKILFRLIPHATAKYIRSGKIHVQSFEADSRKLEE